MKLFSPIHSTEKSTSNLVFFWFGLSLITPLYFGLIALQKAFSHPYVVQDDVRQHVFWMQRFVDPELFPNDLIADYFQAIAPAGYKAFYYAMAQLGIEPLLMAKLLPMILGLIAAIYGFWVAFELLPIPFAAFVGATILNQSLWLEDDIVTATPRAFLYPLFLAFLYYLLKRSPLCLGAIALLSVFYPQLALISVGILGIRLVHWQDGKIALSRHRKDYILSVAGASIALILFLTFAADLSNFGPTVTAAQMREMVEFQPHGRANYFDPNPLKFWLEGDSGLSPSTNPPILWVSLFLPILLKKQHPLAQFVSSNIRILTDSLIPSFGLFILAHLLVLRLYSPSRYTQHSLRLVMAFAAGIAVTMFLETCSRWLHHYHWQNLKGWQKGFVSFSGFFIVISIIIPALPLVASSGHNQLIGRDEAVYEFFARQPKDILVASSSLTATNLPTFSQRSILASWEHALPYHLGYYNLMRQRAIDLIRAQYSPNLTEVKQFIDAYGIDYFLLEKGDFNPDYITNNFWLIQYQPDANQAIARLQQRPRPIMARLMNRCSALKTDRFIVVDARCVAGVPPR